MTVGHGIGLGVGDTDAIAILQSSDAPLTDRPVLIRPATLQISATGARLGAPRNEPGVISGFLGAVGDPDGITDADGTTYLAEDLVATATSSLIATAARQFPGFSDTPELVTVHPARWNDDRVAALRGALDRGGLSAVRLVPDAVASAAWLEATQPPAGEGTVAVCDVGATGLTVSLVDADGDEPRLLSSTFSSFSGDDRGAPAVTGEDATEPAGAGDFLDSALTLAKETLLADVDEQVTLRGILLTGDGAAIPALAERAASTLPAPVVVTPDPARTAVHGAAILAAGIVGGTAPAATPVAVVGLDGTLTDRLPVIEPPRRPLAFTESMFGNPVSAAAAGPATAAPTAPPRDASTPSRRALVAAGIALFLLVVMIAGAAAATRGDHDTDTSPPDSTTAIPAPPAATAPAPGTAAAAPTTSRPADSAPPRPTTIGRPPATTAVAPPPVVATRPPAVATTTVTTQPHETTHEQDPDGETTTPTETTPEETTPPETTPEETTTERPAETETATATTEPELETPVESEPQPEPPAQSEPEPSEAGEVPVGWGATSTEFLTRNTATRSY
jgi:hypothetical protein